MHYFTTGVIGHSFPVHHNSIELLFADLAVPVEVEFLDHGGSDRSNVTNQRIDRTQSTDSKGGGHEEGNSRCHGYGLSAQAQGGQPDGRISQLFVS